MIIILYCKDVFFRITSLKDRFLLRIHIGNNAQPIVFLFVNKLID